MDVNHYIVIGIICRLASILMLLAIVIPRQLREFEQPRDEVSIYRWLLFGMSLSFISLSIFPFVYQVGQVDSPAVFNLQNLASVSSNLSVLVLVSLFTTIYLLVRKRKGT